MLPLGINAKYLGAGSVFVFVQGSVLRSGYHWSALLASKIRACTAARPSYLAVANNFMQFSIRYTRFCFSFLTQYLTTLDLKPASCHLLLVKMPDVVCAQQSHFGLKNLIKVLWDWWTGQIFFWLGKISCDPSELPYWDSQCNDVCSTTSFLGEQSAVSPCVLNKQTLCGNWS